MRLRFGNGLLLSALFTILLVAIVILLPTSPIRPLLGIICLIFIPGYVTTIALFPDNHKIDLTERIAYSVGLSFVIVPLLTLVLNFTTWGIHLVSVLSLSSCYVIYASSIGWLRQNKLKPVDRYYLKLDLRILDQTNSLLHRILISVLSLLIISSVGTFIYFVATSSTDEPFTEFYILSEDGTTEDYPKSILLGDPINLVLVIDNHENTKAVYTINELIEGQLNNTYGPFDLENDHKLEFKVEPSPSRLGLDQKIEYILYKDSAPTPYLDPLYLIIDVSIESE